MKRRNFLQIFGTVVAGATMPMLAAEATPTVFETVAPWSAARLTAEMDAMFNSRMGPAMAFFELTPDDGVKYAELVGAMGEQHDVMRVTYQTFAVGIEGGTAADAEAQLAKHFYTEFQRYAADKPLMYWRRQPEFQSAEYVEYGETYITAEEIEDEIWKKIPAVDEIKFPDTYRHLNQFKGTRWRYDENAQLVIPEGVELDFNTGAYKYVTKRTQLHKMSMRLAIPSCWGNHDIEQFAHPEGERVTRI